MTEDAITTENLTKHFGDVRAVESVSLNVGRGEIYGFLGLNGAGKSTTIGMLMGMIHSTSGSAFLFGEKVDPFAYRLWESVGFLAETPNACPELTVHENLEIVRRMRGLADRDAVDSAIDRLGLAAYGDRKARHLSLGNARRLGLARALIHDPDLLILDEPANGLDPAGIVEIRHLLRELASDRGVTVFISSHILGEVSRVVDRIGIIHEGRLLQEVPADRLESFLKRELIVDARDRRAACAILEEAGYGVRSSEEGPLGILDEDAIRHPEEIARVLVNGGEPPTLLNVEEEELESYFLRMLGVDAR
ncbi:MAG: ABC transporter ATP-binding protein [Methanospirillum sp.]